MHFKIEKNTLKYGQINFELETNTFQKVYKSMEKVKKVMMRWKSGQFHHPSSQSTDGHFKIVTNMFQNRNQYI